MLVIRLARAGRTKYPVYRIVAAESSRAVTSKFVEILGHYNPHTKELVIKKEATIKRLQHGAQPSNSVAKLLQKEKIELPGWVKVKTKSRRPKNAPGEAEASAPASETPAVNAEEETAENPPEPSPEAENPAVAVAATQNAAEVEDKAAAKGATETAETTEAAAESAEAASDAAAESAANGKP